ncbi:MAG: glycosyl transferase family 1 [Cyanobacteria bacterium QS_4_48_99]|nr:MAG: glycosyl transferase family 1 [Cyanobacteria bacterium QS_4_48_99]
MKVLHVIPSVAPVRGGPSQAVLEMVKGLRSQGLDAEIATTNDNGSDLLAVPLQQRTEYQQVPVWFFPRFSPAISSIREFAFSSQLTAWLWQHVSDYDLLHVHAIFSYPSTAAMAIARLRGIPYINRPLGQLCTWSLQQKESKKKTYLALIEHANLNHSQALHLTSSQEEEELSQLNFKAPSFILPHGLSLPTPIPNARHQLRQHLNLPEDEPIILFMSRLHSKKGLEYLIPALGKLSHKCFHFILAGNGSPEYEAQIDELLTAAGMHDRTYRPGFVSGEMKNLFSQGSDLFALTSHSENFGIVVLEAMAAGLPVLATPGVALASVVKQDQLGYVTELDVPGIATAIEHHLNHPQQAKAMGDRARQLIFEQYTWDKMAAKLSATYEAILLKQ